jgi:hypothetical protein
LFYSLVFLFVYLPLFKNFFPSSDLHSRKKYDLHKIRLSAMLDFVFFCYLESRLLKQ